MKNDANTISMFESEACNPDEAPAGYYAVPKSSLRHEEGNLCRQCDWRAQCNNPATDLLTYGHRCMSNPVLARRDGKTYRRADGCGVAFKKRPPETAKGKATP